MSLDMSTAIGIRWERAPDGSWQHAGPAPTLVQPLMRPRRSTTESERYVTGQQGNARDALLRTVRPLLLAQLPETDALSPRRYASVATRRTIGTLGVEELGLETAVVDLETGNDALRFLGLLVAQYYPESSLGARCALFRGVFAALQLPGEGHASDVMTTRIDAQLGLCDEIERVLLPLARQVEGGFATRKRLDFVRTRRAKLAELRERHLAALTAVSRGRNDDDARPSLSIVPDDVLGLISELLAVDDLVRLANVSRRMRRICYTRRRLGERIRRGVRHGGEAVDMMGVDEMVKLLCTSARRDGLMRGGIVRCRAHAPWVWQHRHGAMCGHPDCRHITPSEALAAIVPEPNDDERRVGAVPLHMLTRPTT